MIILLRGWPGSGKSTLAKQLHEHIPESEIFAVDDFWKFEGNVIFAGWEAEVAQDWNRKRVLAYCSQNTSLNAIVDSTHPRIVDINYYEALASKTGHILYQAIPEDVNMVQCLRKSANIDKQIKALEIIRKHVKRNLHGVLESSIVYTANNFEESNLPIYIGHRRYKQRTK